MNHRNAEPRSRLSMVLRTGLLIATVVLGGIVGTACGGDDTSVTDTPVDDDTTPADQEITLVAENIAFDAETITVTAGREVTITFENRDSIAHNLRIVGPDGDFATEVASGPVTQQLTFTIDEPGRYEFRCDVHPAQMSGTLIVTP
ncbi:MAG: cupredoxin domain-containing protein [Acidimicrobiales bacterium]